MIFGFNKNIACEPLPEMTIAPEVSKGFARIKNKVTLVPTKVVFGNGQEHIGEGATVYLLGDVIAQPWSKTVYEVAGKSVILVPVDQVKLISYAELEAWAPKETPIPGPGEPI